MEIEVRLYATLRRYRPESAGGALHHPFVVDLTAGATVATLLTHLGIPEGLVAGAARNDDAVETDTLLKEGDKVDLFPPVAGG